MNSKDIELAAKIFANSGISLEIEMPGVGYPTPSFYLNPDEVAGYISNPSEYFAKYFKISKTDFQGWLDSSGYPRCGVIKSDGKRCKNWISGERTQSPIEWLQKNAGFCAVHGGTKSQARQ